MRLRFRRIGITPNRHPLWTDRERDLVKSLYPDYRALRRALRRRTYNALRAQARACGVAKSRRMWTALEVSLLRKTYPTKSKADLLELFPGCSWTRIVSKKQELGLRKKKKPYIITGHPLLDQTRERAFELGYSMSDVDALAGTRNYFQRAGWLNHKRPNAIKLLKAIEALGGSLYVNWD